jgi:hypothetical protein
MAECTNPNCKKKKLIDGFPVIKEGVWRYESDNYTIDPSGTAPRNFKVNIDLNFISQGKGFVFGDNTVNPTSENDIMGVWKATGKNFDLYLVQDRPDNGIVIVSPSKYECGKAIEFRGIFTETGFSPGNVNQEPAVGQIKVFWKSELLKK